MRAQLNLASVSVRLIVSILVFITIPWFYYNSLEYSLYLGNYILISIYVAVLFVAVLMYRTKRLIAAPLHWFFATLDVLMATVVLLFQHFSGHAEALFFIGLIYSIALITASLSESSINVIVSGALVIGVHVVAFFTFGEYSKVWLVAAGYFAVQTGLLAFVARVRKEAVNGQLRTKNLTLISPLYRIYGIQNAMVYSQYGTLFVRNTYPDIFVGADFVAAKEVDGSILVIVGDCVGHGTDASQGAKACLVAFHTPACNDTWSAIQIMHSVLQQVPTIMGGEAFVLALRIFPGGRVIMEGKLEDVRVHTISNEPMEKSLDEEIATYGQLLGRSDTKLESRPAELHLKMDQVLVVQTDGARYKDHTDDQTSVTISPAILDIGAESDGVREWVMAGNPIDDWSIKHGK